MQAIIIKTDKTVEHRDVTFSECQEIVGGLVEAVTLSDGSAIFANEEGRFMGLDFNSIATDVAGLGGRTDVLLMGLLGNAVIVGPPNSKGETQDVTEQATRWVERVAREA